MKKHFFYHWFPGRWTDNRHALKVDFEIPLFYVTTRHINRYINCNVC